MAMSAFSVHELRSDVLVLRGLTEPSQHDLKSCRNALCSYMKRMKTLRRRMAIRHVTSGSIVQG